MKILFDVESIQLYYTVVSLSSSTPYAKMSIVEKIKRALTLCEQRELNYLPMIQRLRDRAEDLVPPESRVKTLLLSALSLVPETSNEARYAIRKIASLQGTELPEHFQNDSKMMKQLNYFLLQYIRSIRSENHDDTRIVLENQVYNLIQTI